MKIIFCASNYKMGLTVLLTEHIMALAKQPNVQILAISGEGEQEVGLGRKVVGGVLPSL